jgi:hypothetical protein
MYVDAAVKPTLSEVSERFKQWRLSPDRGRTIPKELWETAIELTKQHSISKVSKALNVSDAKLRKLLRMQSSALKPSFMELDLDRMVPQSHCSIEIEKGNGSKLKINFTGDWSREIIEIGKAFCGAA